MAPDARPSTDGVTRLTCAHLPDDETAPRRARRLVRDTLTSWQLDDLLDDAELAMSELVTNALKHGLPPVVLEIRQSSGSLRIAVSDARPSTAHHEVRVASRDDDESGRGQGIIEAVSDQSGVDDAALSGKSSYAAWDVVPADPTCPVSAAGPSRSA